MSFHHDCHLVITLCIGLWSFISINHDLATFYDCVDLHSAQQSHCLLSPCHGCLTKKAKWGGIALRTVCTRTGALRAARGRGPGGGDWSVAASSVAASVPLFPLGLTLWPGVWVTISSRYAFLPDSQQTVLVPPRFQGKPGFLVGSSGSPPQHPTSCSLRPSHTHYFLVPKSPGFLDSVFSNVAPPPSPSPLSNHLPHAAYRAQREGPSCLWEPVFFPLQRYNL